MPYCWDNYKVLRCLRKYGTLILLEIRSGAVGLPRGATVHVYINVLGFV